MHARADAVRWGILGAARIAVKHVIPAIETSGHSRIEAVASRDAAAAERVAAQFGIPRAYGSYEALLADPKVDAVYIPLPNHLHVPWSLRARCVSSQRSSAGLTSRVIAINMARSPIDWRRRFP